MDLVIFIYIKNIYTHGTDAFHLWRFLDSNLLTCVSLKDYC